MILSIDTTDPQRVSLVLTQGNKKTTHIFQTDHNLSEKLVSEIKKFLLKQKVKLNQLEKIEAPSGQGYFSRIRTAVATANALAYGLKINQKIIQSVYSGQPNISVPKRTNLTSFSNGVR